MSLRLAYFAASASFAVVTALALNTRDKNTMVIAITIGVVALVIYAAKLLRDR